MTEQDFLHLLETNRGIIIKICHSYCQDKSFREDLAQEIVYQLWKSADKYNGGHKFSTWMYRIALNVAISFYRRQQAKPAIVAFENSNAIDMPAVFGENGKEEDLQRMQELIATMNAFDKALVLLYLESKTYAEIAEILGITETNVATKLSRIKAKMKQEIKVVRNKW